MSDYLPSPEELAAFETATPVPSQPVDVIRHPKRDWAMARNEPELPPHSVESEQGVLGCILEDSNATLDLCSEKLNRFGGSAFYDLRHQLLYSVMREMWEAHKPIDLISVVSELGKRGITDQCGGMPYLLVLRDATPSAANIEHYLDTVAEYAGRRQWLRITVELAARARAESDFTAFQATAQTEIMALADAGCVVKSSDIGGCIKRFTDLFERAVRGRQEITGVPTGLHMLDNMTCGLQRGEMTVIAARPSVGKTALGVTLSIHALRHQERVLFHSIEMGENALMHRLVGSVARVDTLKFRNGFVSDPDTGRILKAMEEMNGWKGRMFIDDRTALTGRDLFTSARRHKNEHGVTMVVLDYLQLMRAVKSRNSREEEIAEVADWVKQTAKDLDLVVVVMAQLNKDSERERKPREPRLSDIRESDRIAQNSDVVGLLWQRELDDDEPLDMKWIRGMDADDPKEHDGWHGERKTLVLEEGGRQEKFDFPREWRKELRRVTMTVAKNRQGATGHCELVLQNRTTRFVDAYRPEYGRKPDRPRLQIEGEEI